MPVVFEVFGVGATAVPAGDGWTQVADPADFDGTPGTWARDDALAGGTVWLGLGAETAAATVVFAE
ncbi:MAG: hypothetical protein EP329_12090 [Deltaproteobacteria bacterium]|nr:MAG: hypothetical protein EP329_12090 [Deltaproteobacteria bacterium]